jgi:hypothetical protein
MDNLDPNEAWLRYEQFIQEIHHDDVLDEMCVFYCPISRDRLSYHCHKMALCESLDIPWGLNLALDYVREVLGCHGPGLLLEGYMLEESGTLLPFDVPEAIASGLPVFKPWECRAWNGDRSKELLEVVVRPIMRPPWEEIPPETPVPEETF